MGSPFDVSYSGVHRFEAPPTRVWDELRRIDLFERWWPWMKDVRLAGEPLAPGSVISFRVDPPVPYKMDIRVEVTDAQEPSRIAGSVSRDLIGSASLVLEARGDETLAHVQWDVELANRRIRAGILIARPILLWAQRWAVEVSLRGFRAYLRGSV